MLISNAHRQVEEIKSFQNKWYGHAITISTPTLFTRLQKVTNITTASSNKSLATKKMVSYQLNCSILHPEELSNLTLHIQYPFTYPTESNCIVQALFENKLHVQCTSLITQYLSPFESCENLEFIIEWLAENKSTCLLETDADNETKENGTIGPDQICCYILRYNHLLAGSEHKKEKQMVDTAKKMKLQGGILWGTPGIVLLVYPTTEEDAKEYAKECRTIGKRADGVEEIGLKQIDVETIGLGGLSQTKRGNRLLNMDTGILRVGCGNNEDTLRRILGVC